jgi:hypothetical protein
MIFVDIINKLQIQIKTTLFYNGRCLMGSQLKGLISYWKHIEQGIGAKFLFYTLCMYSQTCAQQPPLGPQKSGRCSEGGRFSGFGPKL